MPFTGFRPIAHTSHMLIKWIGTFFTTGLYFIWVLCIALLVAIADEPGQFLLAVYADSVGLIGLFLSVFLARSTKSPRVSVINNGTLVITGLFLCLITSLTYLGDKTLAQDFYTLENIAEVNTYLLTLICMQASKMVFIGWEYWRYKKRIEER